MTERKSGEIIDDPQNWSFVFALITAYDRGDRSVPLERVQEAAIEAIKKSRKIDQEGKSYIAYSPVSVEKLKEIHIDPITLLPEQT